jgi:hypothetical protein
MNLAEAIAPQRRLDQAEALALDALRYFEIEENDLRRAQCYRVLGDIQVLRGCRGEAERLYFQGVGLARSVGSDREATRIRDAMELLSALR